MTIDETVAMVREKATPWVGDMGGALIAHPVWEYPAAMRCVQLTVDAFRSFRGNSVEALCDWLRRGGPLPDPFEKDGFYHWIVHCVCEYVNRKLDLTGDDQLECRHVTLLLKTAEGVPADQVVGEVRFEPKCPGHTPFSVN